MSSYVPTVLSAVRPGVFDREVDRIFDEALQALGTTDRAWAPACNAWEDGNGFYVQAALPGWEPAEISLEIENQVLTLKGERKKACVPEGTCHLREIADGRFARLFRLPGFVDHGKASATHKNGILTVTFPKREEAKSRRIMIDG